MAIQVQQVSSEQITLLADHIQQIASGKLHLRIQVDPNDPLHPISEALNLLIDQYETNIVDMTQSLTHIVSTVINENSFLNGIAKNSNTISASTEQISSSSEELSASVNVIASNLHDANQDAIQVKTYAQQGQQKLHSFSSTITTILGSYHELGEQMNRLDQHVSSIEEFVKIIHDISNQTNLLALNAAIEAARAGDFGRGFGVVAQEVRKLAEGTKHAAGNIAGKVTGIVQETKNTIAQLHTLKSETETSMLLSNETQQANQLVVHSIEHLIRCVADITPALEEQSSLFEEITSTIASVSEASSSNSFEIKNSTEHLYELGIISEQLRQKLGKLQVKLLPSQIIELAITDHLLWKWRIDSMQQGFIQLDSQNVINHKICRLGKWYYGDGSELFSHLPTFSKIEQPHATFHKTCSQLIEAFQRNDHAQVENLNTKVNQLSHEVVSLLNQLKTDIAKSS